MLAIASPANELQPGATKRQTCLVVESSTDNISEAKHVFARREAFVTENAFRSTLLPVCMQSEPVHLRARARHAMDACASMSMRGMYADMRADMRELRARMEKHAQRHLCEGDAAIGNAATISQLTRHQLRARTHNFMRSVCSEISGSFAGAERHRSRSQRNSEKTCRRRMLAISG